MDLTSAHGHGLIGSVEKEISSIDIHNMVNFFLTLIEDIHSLYILVLNVKFYNQ